jgi:hypothetical protein
LPTAGVSGLLAAVQWHGSYGALVAVDPTTGAVIHTYTTGITDPGHDILRYRNDVYFVSKTDIHGCSTEWSGIDLVTGNPAVVPSALTERPIQSAAMTTDGRIVTAAGMCSNDAELWSYANSGATHSVIGAGNDRSLALSPDGNYLAVITTDAPAVPTSGPTTSSQNPVTKILVVPGVFGIDPNSANFSPTLPDGCTPTALNYLGNELVAGVRCAQSNGTSILTVLRWDQSRALIMRKDVPATFKEASISDVAAVANGIYYVVNAEGLESYLYKLGTTKTDATVPAANLFHIAAQP